LIAAAVLLPLVTNAQSGTDDLASRIELHPIESNTLTIDQILEGRADGGIPATIVGQLRIAQGAGRRPLVMMLHGGGGVDARADTWSRQFNEMGISTFVIDGFTGRGIENSGIEQTLERLNSMVDAFRGLQILARHPRVDTSRIALMGFSFGAHASLYAAMQRFHRLWNPSQLEFAAYVAFYPNCSVGYVDELDVVDRPIKIFHGMPDDANPIAPCQAYVERVRAAGGDIELTEYPNAQHGFDNPLLPPAFNEAVQSMRRCVVREEPIGVLVNAASGDTFTYQDPCVERGVHTGHDARATREAHKDVTTFLREVLLSGASTAPSREER
jgi:dienelactone hydrolase